MANFCYNESGYLVAGKISCTGDEFISEFCQTDIRKDFQSAVINILDFAKDKGASRIIVGGSFVSKKDNPNDLDCLIVFPNDLMIPSFVDCALFDKIQYDILYASEQNPKSIDTFIKLLSTNIYDVQDKGIVEILLNGQHPWKINYQPNKDEFTIVQRVYTMRNIIERNKRRGMVISIHGIRTKAKWNSTLAPIVNSQGWMFAPFIYEGGVELLFCERKRRKIVEQFRDWIYHLSEKYEVTDFSVLCHSFGTYIISQYLDGFRNHGCAPVCFDSIVLTGGIIKSDFDWQGLNPNMVGRVLNVMSLNDSDVKMMPDSSYKKYIGMSSDFGKCGLEKIENQQIVSNKEFNIFTHSNILKDDFLETIFLPFINANVGIVRVEK